MSWDAFIQKEGKILAAAKPCHFCGDEDLGIEDSVICHACGARGPFVHQMQRKGANQFRWARDAVRLWNMEIKPEPA